VVNSKRIVQVLLEFCGKEGNKHFGARNLWLGLEINSTEQYCLKRLDAGRQGCAIGMLRQRPPSVRSVVVAQHDTGSLESVHEVRPSAGFWSKPFESLMLTS
jgi:hypothetical protein